MSKKFVTFEKTAAQGDLYIRRVSCLPDDATEIKSEKNKHIVAHSETGHHHFVDAARARFYGTSNPMICYLQIDESADLVHDREFDTHTTIRMTDGVFELRRQREHTPEGWRRVED